MIGGIALAVVILFVAPGTAAGPGGHEEHETSVEILSPDPDKTYFQVGNERPHESPTNTPLGPGSYKVLDNGFWTSGVYNNVLRLTVVVTNLDHNHTDFEATEEYERPQSGEWEMFVPHPDDHEGVIYQPHRYLIEVFVESMDGEASDKKEVEVTCILSYWFGS